MKLVVTIAIMQLGLPDDVLGQIPVVSHCSRDLWDVAMFLTFEAWEIRKIIISVTA